jgi:hypothetical protein
MLCVSLLCPVTAWLLAIQAMAGAEAQCLGIGTSYGCATANSTALAFAEATATALATAWAQAVATCATCNDMAKATTAGSATLHVKLLALAQAQADVNVCVNGSYSSVSSPTCRPPPTRTRVLLMVSQHLLWKGRTHVKWTVEHAADCPKWLCRACRRWICERHSPSGLRCLCSGQGLCPGATNCAPLQCVCAGCSPSHRRSACTFLLQ